MSDPARAAENRQRRAAVAAARAGDGDLAAEILAAGQDIPETTPEPAAPAVDGTPIVASNGTSLASASDFQRLARQVEAQGRRIAQLEQQLAQTQRGAKKFITASRRWMSQYGASFSEFHAEASGTRDGLSGGLDMVARGLSGYMDGINWGEVPANPTLLGLAKGLEGIDQGSGDPLLGSFAALGGTVLRYMAYQNPLNSNSGGYYNPNYLPPLT